MPSHEAPWSPICVTTLYLSAASVSIQPVPGAGGGAAGEVHRAAPEAAGGVALAVVEAVADAFGLGGIYALMAVGIGLVFGVLRLVNFAYGQLVMAGAYTLAFTSSWPTWTSILTCVAVVANTREIGKLRVAKGHVMTVQERYAMDFLIKGVIGSPKG